MEAVCQGTGCKLFYNANMRWNQACSIEANYIGMTQSAENFNLRPQTIQFLVAMLAGVHDCNHFYCNICASPFSFVDASEGSRPNHRAKNYILVKLHIKNTLQKNSSPLCSQQVRDMRVLEIPRKSIKTRFIICWNSTHLASVLFGYGVAFLQFTLYGHNCV